MNKYLFLVFLGTLLVGTTSHAQSITFDFTAGSFNGTTWTHTVAGVTCTATYGDDGSGLSVEDLAGGGKTFIDSSKGMYMGEYVSPSSDIERIVFARPGARITFSHDVRLKSYTLGRLPGSQNTVCIFVGAM